MDTCTPTCFSILCFINRNKYSSIQSYVFYVYGRVNSLPHRSISVLTLIKVKTNVVNFHKLDSDFTATCYELDGPVIESQWGRIFGARSVLPRRPPSLPYNGYRIISGSKTAGAWCWPPTSFYHPDCPWIGATHIPPATLCACTDTSLPDMYFYLQTHNKKNRHVQLGQQN
jgi:hypothetical protein